MHVTEPCHTLDDFAIPVIDTLSLVSRAHRAQRQSTHVPSHSQSAGLWDRPVSKRETIACPTQSIRSPKGSPLAMVHTLQVSDQAARHDLLSLPTAQYLTRCGSSLPVFFRLNLAQCESPVPLQYSTQAKASSRVPVPPSARVSLCKNVGLSRSRLDSQLRQRYGSLPIARQ